MGRRRDKVTDPDGGSGGLAAKVALVRTSDEAADRAAFSEGLRDLDRMTEQMDGLSRARRDRERLMPRDTTAPLGDPRMQRPLPVVGAQRVPLSSRQKKDRSRTRVAVQGGLPDSQYRAQRHLMTDPGEWVAVNDELSASVGDVQALSERRQQQVRRIDKSIQAYEKANARGHTVYCNVVMPRGVNRGNLGGFLNNEFRPGRMVVFDRYTYTTHQLHETTRDAGRAGVGRVAVFEIQTRRGAYLGHSDSMDDTSHLLPRGMRLQVVGVSEAPYQAPDGTTGSRMVVQLRDVTPEPAAAERRPGRPRAARSGNVRAG